MRHSDTGKPYNNEFRRADYFVSTVGLDEEYCSSVHPRSGRQGRALRPDEVGNRVKPPRAAHDSMGAFEALTIQAPGFAGDWLLQVGTMPKTVRIF
jgi:hypothetical protein